MKINLKKIVKNSFIYPFYVYIRQKQKIISIIQKFGVEQYSRKMIMDMIKMKFVEPEHYGYDEYLVYQFYNLNMEERKQFVSDYERANYVRGDKKVWNNPANKLLFDDKIKTYELFGKYYKREILYISEEDIISSIDDNSEGYKKFKGFIDKHNDFFVKPLDGGMGVGGGRYKAAEIENPWDFFKGLLIEYVDANGHNVKKGTLMEELVINAPELAQFHPQSLNTVRVPTFKFSNGIENTEIIHPFLRLGQGDSVVDNAGAGGIICCIDVDSGKIVAACDEFGKTFKVHPDSGLEIIGYTIPKWEEAKQIAKELAQVVEDNHYTGWDLALTENGWVMIEGNAGGQFVWQMPLQKGFRDELRLINTRLGEFSKN